MVFIVTLVGGGLSLASLVRLLRITGGREELDEIARAHARSSEAALARITELESAGRIAAAHASAMRRAFEHRSELQLLDDGKSALQHLG